MTTANAGPDRSGQGVHEVIDQGAGTRTRDKDPLRGVDFDETATLLLPPLSPL